MVKHVTEGIRVRTLYLVRHKQLKGGRKAIRSMRRITPQTEHVHHPKGILLKVSYEGVHGLIQLEGMVDQTLDRLVVDPTLVQLKGYLKTRGFQVLGYDLDYRVTNLHGRNPRAQQK